MPTTEETLSNLTPAVINLQASTSSQNPDPSPASAHAVSVKLREFSPEFTAQMAEWYRASVS